MRRKKEKGIITCDFIVLNKCGNIFNVFFLNL